MRAGNARRSKGVRILIVESGYYEDIADTLLRRARGARSMPRARAYDVITVPGALEIPQAIVIALDAARGAKAYDGVVALGCVIRGETSHYDIVAGESARALMEIGIAAQGPGRQRHPHRRHRRPGDSARRARQGRQGRHRRRGGARAGAPQARPRGPRKRR